MNLDEDVSIDVGSANERFEDRIRRFERDGAPLPLVRHAAFWVLHNAVAHPLLAVAPSTYTVDVHELTSRWLNKKRFFRPHKVPTIRNRTAWVWHNAVMHPLIAFFPVKVAFDLHDASAAAMGVPGWV